MSLPELTGPKHQPSPPSPPPPPSREADQSGLSSTTDHLDAALSEATAGDIELPRAAVIGFDGGGDVLMERGEWCKMYLGAHDIAGNVIGSAVLANASGRKGAEDAAGAIYDTCAKVKALHFMLSPNAEWFKAATLVAMFYVPMGRELIAERRARMTARPAAKPAAPAFVASEATNAAAVAA
jgi:hypothetical protein